MRYSINDKIGKLTLIKSLGSFNGKIRWLCKCDCGIEKTVNNIHSLTKTASCGCSYALVKDLTGKRFNRLTVIKRSDVRNKQHQIKWICNCDCGKQTEVLGHCLTTNNTKSCGCLNMEGGKRIKEPYKCVFNLIKLLAKRRNIIFDLIYKDILKFIETKSCNYCGDEVCWKPYITQKSPNCQINLDRIDNNQGYNIKNCVVCCFRCNSMKNNLSLDKFISHIKKIYNKHL